jgi:hypothetical protein
MRHGLKELIRLAEEQGWRVEKTHGGHYRWLAPSGAIVVSSSTMSDHRGLQNHLSHLKRAGFRP